MYSRTALQLFSFLPLKPRFLVNRFLMETSTYLLHKKVSFLKNFPPILVSTKTFLKHKKFFLCGQWIVSVPSGKRIETPLTLDRVDSRIVYFQHPLQHCSSFSFDHWKQNSYLIAFHVFLSLGLFFPEKWYLLIKINNKFRHFPDKQTPPFFDKIRSLSDKFRQSENVGMSEFVGGPILIIYSHRATLSISWFHPGSQVPPL